MSYNKVLPIKAINKDLVRILRTATTRKKALTNGQIRNRLNWDLADATVRKLIHNLRISGKIKYLLASPDGYYISKRQADITEYRRSLRGRIREMKEVYVSIPKYAE